MAGSNDNIGRRHGRVTMQRQVRLLVEDRGDWLPVTATAGDLSLGGCSLNVLDPLDIGARVVAAFPGPFDEDRHIIFGIVRHCTFEESAWVKVGISFVEPPEGFDPLVVLRRAFPEAA